jgi:cytidylate kinase
MKNFVITIDRQFYSGGRDIGKMLADELGIKFYDSQLLKEKAKALGIQEGVFDLFDEKPTRSFLFDAVSEPFAVDVAVNEGKVIEAQRTVINDAAKQGSCVIVGRRADKILAENQNVVSIFIGANIDDRIARYQEKEEEKVRFPRRFIERKDRERASYYNYFGDGGWGKADNYTMCFSTSKISQQEIVKIIADYINCKFS